MDKNKKTHLKLEPSFQIEQHRVLGFYSMLKNHYHNAYEIYYLLEGERFYFIKEKTFHIQKGDLVLINMNDLHKTIDAGSEKHERILINFRKDFLGSILFQFQNINLISCFNQNVNVLKLNNSEQDFVQALLHKLIKESKNSSNEAELYKRVLLTELLIFISRCVKQSGLSQIEHPNPIYKKISEIVKYINNNYMEKLTLSTLSEHFYISSFYLSRIFKEITGFSFIEYLNTVRIKESCRLLTETKMSITQISQETGFESITHFGRTFKALLNISPLKYRKLNLNN